MKNLMTQAESAGDVETLLGLEGAAARVYFENFHRLLRADGRAGHFDFTTRNRRPPRDPVNALLSFGYAMLCKDIFSVVAMVGFDPYYGFFHGVRRGQPSLALDLMEEFRPLIADSLALTLINKQMISERDFLRFGGACYLNETGRKRFFAAYEARKAAEVLHPVFGYRVSYRRAMEVQARMLAAVLRGDLGKYTGFKVR
jgi:CRISPR-associated protein Cas1